MRQVILGVVCLVAAITACSDDPVATGRGEVASSVSEGTDPLSKANRLPATLEAKVQKVRAELERQGYAVARGYMTLWGAEDCKAPMQTVGFCYGNNPTAPYVLAVVPHWKDEHVDQALHHALLKGQRDMSAIYRLDEREALVILAELPPPARYLGVATNVFTREATLNTSDPIYTNPLIPAEMRSILFAPAPVPSRWMLIASIGNTTNNVNIVAQSGSVWNQQRFFVVTPDRGVAGDVTVALESAGVPAEHVFTEPVASSLMKLGVGPEADDFITYIRYALPNDPVAGEAWRKQLPLTVLRVRDRSLSGTSDPFPLQGYDARRYNTDESGLAAQLTTLVDAVKADWKQPMARTITYFSLTHAFDLVGQHCLGSIPGRGPMDCLGDNQDDEPLIGPSVHLDGDTVLAVVGTLATETHNATYVSLSVNWFPYLVGLQNLSDTDLKGTAAKYLTTPDANQFYVWYFARDCTGLENCLEVSRKLIPAGETIKAIVRNYVVPGDARGRGPDPMKLLMPKAIILDGSGR